MDTDTLLALVYSLLEDGDRHDHATVLDTLVQSEGDVQQAAQLLNSREHPRSPAKFAAGKGKEKAQMKGGLDGWLQHASGPIAASSSTSGLKRTRSHSPQEISRQCSPSEESLPSKKPKSMSSSTISKRNRVTNEQFMAMLRPPKSTDAKNAGPTKFPPLTLTTSEQVAKHTPCTLHTAVLPPELACRLFYAMMDDSESWQRNKWWLFDRVVESPHRTSFFVRRALPETGGTTHEDMQEAAQFWYNGRQTAPPEPFPPAVEEACSYIEKIVNAEMHKRNRYPLEWGGDPPAENSRDEVGNRSQEEDSRVIWRANVAASNRYEGSQEGVGFRSDQLTNLGPYPTIASLSLGTTRIFRLREVIPTEEKDIRSARTYNMPLAHNTLVIMHASCQEMFKHSIPPQRTIDPFHPLFPHNRRTERNAHPGLVESVSESDGSPPSNARINITFRFYRPDFRSSTTPRCNCGIPCILRPDMKNRYSASNPEKSVDKEATEGAKNAKKDVVTKYWWTCYAGAQNDGKGCGVWKVMDVKAEGRGPFAGDVP